VLDHAELWKDLPADLHRGLPIHANEEASFSVDENQPPIRDSGFPADYLYRSDCHSSLSTVGFTRCPSI
jgi:hypothetical protein